VFQVNKCFRAAPGGNVPDAPIADPQSSDTDGTILTTVDGTANTYTLAYGTTTRTFPIKAPTTPTPLLPVPPTMSSPGYSPIPLVPTNSRSR
jgi:hypothetical protein